MLDHKIMYELLAKQLFYFLMIFGIFIVAMIEIL